MIFYYQKKLTLFTCIKFLIYKQQQRMQKSVKDQ